MQIPDDSQRANWFIQLAGFALVVAILRFAADVLMPVAFAVLLAFLLSPLVVRLMRWGLPKTVAIIATVVVTFTILGAVGWIVTSQAMNLIRELPNYEENIQKKILALKQPHRPAAVSRMAGMIENLRKELKAPNEEVKEREASTTEAKPVQVEVHPAEPTPLELASDFATPILRPLGIAGIVIVFVVAILFQREDLRDRFIKLVSAGKLNIATDAVDDAARRISRYLGMQLVVNATYGIPVGIGLFLIGIPNALLWGLLATLLRFIPFLGPWIAAAFPVALALAVDPGWTKVLYTTGLFIVMEVISNNFIEVVLYGASTGISNFALLVAAVFWTWLWGAPGLVLSTPMTVCLLVLGMYVPGFKILSMLLGSEPVLEPPAQFYQRMLSMESEDMLELAGNFVEERSLEEFYEEVFLPALIMSEKDRHSGALSAERQRFIFQSSLDLVEELERQEETSRTESSTAVAAGPDIPVVLGIAARDDADEIVAQMVCHLLRRRGISAAVGAREARPREIADAVHQKKMKAVFISALPPSAVVGARQMWRRLSAECPDVPILVGVWRHDTALDDLGHRLRVTQADQVVTTLEAALTHVENILRSGNSGAAQPRNAPAQNSAPLAVGS